MKTSPRKLFLIDGLGAFLSYLILSLVLIPLQPKIGMPVAVLEYLSFMAFSIAIFSFFCFYFIKQHQKSFLSVVAILNIFYLIISIFFMYHTFQDLTVLGVCYFIVEKGIILTLVWIEAKIAFDLTDEELDLSRIDYFLEDD